MFSSTLWARYIVPKYKPPKGGICFLNYSWHLKFIRYNTSLVQSLSRITLIDYFLLARRLYIGMYKVNIKWSVFKHKIKEEYYSVEEHVCINHSNVNVQNIHALWIRILTSVFDDWISELPFTTQCGVC